MLSKILKEKLVCTWCLSALTEGPHTLTCTRCGAVYEIVDDIPNMLLEAARLFCPHCRRELEKDQEQGAALCRACGRRYSLRERISPP